MLPVQCLTLCLCLALVPKQPLLANILGLLDKHLLESITSADQSLTSTTQELRMSSDSTWGLREK